MKKLFLILMPMVFMETSCGLEEQLLSEIEEEIEYDTITIDSNTSLLVPVNGFSYSLNGAGRGNGDNTPADNPVTDAGAALGKVLFYDRQLSLNSTRSCGSCHIQSMGFADGVQFSEGFNGEFTGRNSMSLANSRFYRNGRFFWDERAATLEDQVLMPIQDAKEMGMTLDEAVSRIAASDFYDDLFIAAFGDSAVSSERMSLALAQFVRSMDSFSSRFDQAGLGQGRGRGGPPGRRGGGGGPDNGLSELENQGRRLFFSGRTNCGRCHQGAALSGNRARNNGLSILNDDLGKAGASGDNGDLAEFKVPSLKNIEVTGPYMHDGRFASLEEVVEHYNSGVVDNGNLDIRMRTALNLDAQEKSALLAFMKTFTDEAFLSDPKFSDPFVRSE